MSRERPPFVEVRYGPVALEVERRDAGVLVLRSREALAPYARSLGEYLERWARERPEAVFLAQRDASGGWRTLGFGAAREKVRSLAAAFLERGLCAERPVAILSDNGIEHGLVSLAAMHAGVPVAPISPAYSLLSRDFAKLRSVVSLLDPGLVFADDGDRFAPAVAALDGRDFEFVACRGAAKAAGRPVTAFAQLASTRAGPEVDRAFAGVGADTVAKILFTSGSTGEPKGVINTQRMLCSNQQSLAQAWPFLAEEPPVLVDWLPWSHTFGGNNNFGTALRHGGTLYIDEGKPAPGLIEKTVANLREVAPTVYQNVPRGYDILLPFLERDGELCRRFFSRLKVVCYAGAALPATLWERIERLSVATTGRRVRMTSGWGSTETAPQVTLVHFDLERPGVIGLPTPGCELKMVPVEDGGQQGKYELRVRGPNVTPGYWKRPDLTREAFDEEGFYCIGDAGRFAEPRDPARGIEFAGRLAEEFKLATGTWVHTGALRVRAISALAPVAQDIVLTGQDRDYVGFLIFSNLAGCRGLCPGLAADAPVAEVLSHPAVIEKLKAGMAALRAEGGGSSTYATRALFLQEPASIDAGEITDKGYLNQRKLLARRAAEVERLYADPPGPGVIRLK